MARGPGAEKEDKGEGPDLAADGERQGKGQVEPRRENAGGARQASGGGSFLLMAGKSNPGRALHDFLLETDSNSIQIREEQHWSKRLEIEETAGDAGEA